MQTGPKMFDIPGTFTVRGFRARDAEVTPFGKDTGLGDDRRDHGVRRKQYGTNSGIPFMKITERVEVLVGFGR